MRVWQVDTLPINIDITLLKISFATHFQYFSIALTIRLASSVLNSQKIKLKNHILLYSLTMPNCTLINSFGIHCPYLKVLMIKCYMFFFLIRKCWPVLLALHKLHILETLNRSEDTSKLNCVIRMIQR